MQRLTFVLLATAVLSLSAATAFAQSERRVGLVLAYPAAVGLQWQAADRFALRFDADYGQVSNESTTQFPLGRFVPGLPSFIPESIDVTTQIQSWNVALGVSVLIDIHRSDELRLYLAPRLGVNFANSSYETEIEGNPALLAALTVPADSETSSTAPTGGLAFGASRDLGERFRAFGEAGFNYTRSNTSRDVGVDATTSALGLRAGVGVVVLF